MICKQCATIFEPHIYPSGQKSPSLFCSRSCANKYNHAQPGQKEKRIASLKKALSTPEAKYKKIEASKKSHSNPEVRLKISLAAKAMHSNPIIRAKRSIALKAAHAKPDVKKKLSDSIRASQSTLTIKEKMIIASRINHANPEWSIKVNATKKKNNTFNSSKPEKILVRLAKEKYGDQVVDQYTDSRYYGIADLYIKPEDLFIEFHLHWTHGKEPYDTANPTHQEILSRWQGKAKTSKFYANAIKKWTITDPLKIVVAKKNSVNFLAFYTSEQAKKWLTLEKGVIV